MTTLKNRYGVLGKFDDPSQWEVWKEMMPIAPGGEDLAAKLTFKDRVIKVGWDGRIEVEPNGPA